ncbi:purine-nucleoside phosphorylase [Inquilinus limosus]|uniref:Purine nucleoside permease n=1 Tax=Inquilinus limosus MP06 TaxID=1398085 RepID=A0A0A0D0R4_9PROT|nr:purine nucleoside permease [Inquilinus limosus]KGM31423.1 purine nucleoside permease [Inquilinus limosus MP06]
MPLPDLKHAVAAAALAAFAAAPATAQTPPRPVKVLIISMFGPEAKPWIEQLRLDQEIAVPGLSPDYPAVHCNADGVCQMTTGMGHANAAASTMALLWSRQFDLTRAYVLIAGIAGIDPAKGTLGTAAWARYLVDFGIQHEIDAREMPPGWSSGYLGIGAKDPAGKPPLNYRTEVFRLNEDLLQAVLALSQDAKLADGEAAAAYRARYPEAPANQPPKVVQCDTLAGDTYWHGARIGERAEEWVALLTDGKGSYCTTQQEDNATFEALRRGEEAGLVDTGRVAVLRTASNFDRPHPGQTAADSLQAKSGGFPIAIANLTAAGAPFVQSVVRDWAAWQSGIPVAAR